MKNHSVCSWVLIGGGGHAVVLLETMREARVAEPVGIVDTNPDRHGGEIAGVRVLGGDEVLTDLREQGVTHFVLGIGSTADTEPRRRLFDGLCRDGWLPLEVRHPFARVSPSVQIGPGSQLLIGAIVNTHATLGMNVIVNSGAIVEHDCTIGDHVHLATGCRLAGGVHVGDGTHIGIGATIIQGMRIGRRAVVAAGAVVIRDVPDCAVVGGVPAVELHSRRRMARPSSFVPHNVSYT